MSDIITYNEFNKSKVFARIKKYCAYRDRCHKEVMSKLVELKVNEEISNEILSELIAEGYLNEERYARSFVRGKYRINKWGRNTIIKKLKQNEISQFLINKALEEIIETEYLSNLRHLLEEKDRIVKFKNQYDRYNKLFSYVYRKGYESELIKETIEDLINS